jgi:hypothetical protein
MRDAPRPPRRITSGTIAFYASKAHRLRAEAWRSMMFGLWSRLAKMVRRAFSRWHVCQ